MTWLDHQAINLNISWKNHRKVKTINDCGIRQRYLLLGRIFTLMRQRV